MAKIVVTHTDKANIITPSAGNTTLFYDSDGYLKQKDSTGAVSLVGQVVTGVTYNIEDLGGTNIVTPITGDTLIYDGSFWYNTPAFTGNTELWEAGVGSLSVQTKGTGCLALGDNSIAIGDNSITGDNSFAFGKSCSADNNSFAGGNLSNATGSTSFVYSDSSNCNHDYSAIIGGQNITSLENDMVYVPGLEIVNSKIVMTDKVDGLRYSVVLSGGTLIIETI